MNVAMHIEHAARSAPQQPAVLFEGRSLSYTDLALRTSQVAHLLAGWGTAPGDRIALHLPNIPEFITVYLGALKLGAVVVSLNPMLKSAELAYALQDSGARVVFTTAVALSELEPIRASLTELSHVVSCEGTANSAGVHDLSEVLAGSAGAFETREVSSDHPAAILYTSGTTGKPKGAMLTHGNLRANATETARCVGSQPGDRHLLFLPLSHCFGQNFIMHSAFSTLGCIVLERRYELQATLADIRRHEVSHFYGVPTNYIYLLEALLEKADLASVRFFFSAAASMPREVAERWQQRFGSPIYEGYGLTETSPLATYNHRTAYRPGSVGTPFDGVELKVVRPDGQACAVEEWGEICIKGPNVMAGYFRRQDATREAVRDGWFHSGDIGYRDADGYYYLVDRLKDMINCAGYKVWPREVEEVLYQHSDVAECAVVGHVDATKGERVVAYVRGKPGAVLDARSLGAHCAGQLARYKLPDEYLFDREIPKSPSGKVLKRVLRG